MSSFFKRALWHLLISLLLIVICLLIEISGYYYLAGVPWLDAAHKSCMILSGMGPVIQIENTTGTWFSSLYAHHFLANIGLILSPAAHRIFHILHLEEN